MRRPRPVARATTTAAALLALLGLAATSHSAARALREQVPEVDRHVVVPSPWAGRLLSLGYTELVADVTWVRMLVYYGDGLIHDTGMPDTEALVRLVNALDPTFRSAYVWGAYATTMREGFATQEEYRASVDILRRGLAVFPRDWELNWILGVRLYLDLKEGTADERQQRIEEGAMYIERAMRAPRAPADLPILAASIRTGLGQKERALRDLREMILNTEDLKAREVLENKYAALASETAGRELAEEAARFDAAWKASLPYAPRTWHVLLGSRPPEGFDLDKYAMGDTFLGGMVLADTGNR